MSIWNDTAKELAQLSERHEHVVVAFSGGKDSLAVLDLCVKAFKKVSAFNMYVVPGLKYIEDRMEVAKTRWGVTVVYYPHWLLFRLLKAGVYCDDSRHKDDLPEFTLHDIYTMAMAEAGATLCATGAKNADSLWRRRFFTATAHWNGMLYPIKNWNKFDVLTYLKVNKIPIPEAHGMVSTGIDLATPTLLWTYDNHPEDFKKICEWFPFAEAVVWRRRFYGTTT